MLTFYIDDQSAWIMHGIFVGDDISESIPTPRFDEQSGDGIDGTYRYFLNTYDDVEQSFTCYFTVANGMSWKAKLRYIKAWLLSFNDNQTHQLQFGDDFEWFKKISKIELSKAEYIGNNVGKFEIAITCEPYDYMVEGRYEHTIDECTYNSWFECRPVYVVRGKANQQVWFSVNGMKQNISFTTGTTIYFDVEKGFGYQSDGRLIRSQNHNLDKMKLKNGLNEIKKSDDCNLSIIPNWRCI